MDRARSRAPVLGIGLALGLASVAGAAALAAGASGPPIRAMRWAPRDADPVATFGRAPTECLKPTNDPALALKVELGRAAFRTPLLLGGQAARAGLACETCHKAGRRNPNFVFPGVSGAPGTADVTSSLFSTHRGDGVDNPRPIADLSAAKTVLKVDQDPKTGRLEYFVHGQITEEFDGSEPPKAVLDGVAAYIRQLSPEACPAAATEPVTVGYFLSDARRAVQAARGEAALGDAPAAILALGAARSRLGLVDERFAGPTLAAQRAQVRAADRRLAGAQDALRAHRPDVAGSLDSWLKDSADLEARLAAKAPLSLFDPARLSQAARRRLPG